MPVYFGHLDVVEVAFKYSRSVCRITVLRQDLLKAGANVDALGNDGESPLFRATEREQVEAAEVAALKLAACMGRFDRWINRFGWNIELQSMSLIR